MGIGVGGDGIAVPRRMKAWRWALVGSVSIAMVTWVPLNRTWLRVVSVHPVRRAQQHGRAQGCRRRSRSRRQGPDGDAASARSARQ